MRDEERSCQMPKELRAKKSNSEWHHMGAGHGGYGEAWGGRSRHMGEDRV